MDDKVYVVGEMSFDMTGTEHLAIPGIFNSIQSRMHRIYERRRRAEFYQRDGDKFMAQHNIRESEKILTDLDRYFRLCASLIPSIFVRFTDNGKAERE